MLVLWDIDHTLVEVPNVTTDAFDEGLKQTIDRPLNVMPDMTGRTDRAILRDLLELHTDRDPDCLLEPLAEAVGAAYEARSPQVRQHGTVLPGAKECVAAIAAAGIQQSVLTGNMRRIAHVKLGELGLADELDWDLGAYGMDSVHRWDLVEAARSRAQDRGINHAPVTLIGDTERDVEAALRTGARVIAVATGAVSAQALRAAGADTVLDSLIDTDQVLRLITMGER